LLDNPVKNYFIIHEYDNIYDTLFKIGKEIGKADVLFSFIVVCMVSALLINKKEIFKVLAICLLSTMFASLFVLLFKAGISRERPAPGISNLNFFCYIKAYKMNELFGYKFFSMPSGHTVTVFSAFFPMILYIKNKFYKILLCIIPVITAFSRVCGMQHWTSDVIAGALFGIWIGNVFYNTYKKKIYSDENL
jgi:membrane-associated phospholipid phosphatase